MSFLQQEHKNKRKQNYDRKLTAASLSNLAKSSFSVMTSSWAVHWEARLVKPSMSAKRMLGKREEKQKKSVTKFAADICISINSTVEVWDGKECGVSHPTATRRWAALMHIMMQPLPHLQHPGAPPSKAASQNDQCAAKWQLQTLPAVASCDIRISHHRSTWERLGKPCESSLDCFESTIIWITSIINDSLISVNQY